MAERGVDIDHATLDRWVGRCSPLLVKQARSPFNDAIEVLDLQNVDGRPPIAREEQIKVDVVQSRSTGSAFPRRMLSPMAFSKKGRRCGFITDL